METYADSSAISTTTVERHRDLRRRGGGGGNQVQGSKIGQTIVLAVHAVKGIITGMSAADPPVGRLQMSQRKGRERWGSGLDNLLSCGRRGLRVLPYASRASDLLYGRDDPATVEVAYGSGRPIR
jgi:hypothetical protein